MSLSSFTIKSLLCLICDPDALSTVFSEIATEDEKITFIRVVFAHDPEFDCGNPSEWLIEDLMQIKNKRLFEEAVKLITENARQYKDWKTWLFFDFFYIIFPETEGDEQVDEWEQIKMQIVETYLKEEFISWKFELAQRELAKAEQLKQKIQEKKRVSNQETI